MSLQFSPHYLTRPCLASVPRLQLRPYLQHNALQNILCRHTIRCGLLFYAFSVFLLHPIHSFIPPLCHELPSCFATLPSFRPPLSFFLFLPTFPPPIPLLPSFHLPLPSVTPPLSSTLSLHSLCLCLPSFPPRDPFLIFLPTPYASAHFVEVRPLNRCIYCATLRCDFIIARPVDDFRAKFRFSLRFGTNSVSFPSFINHPFAVLRFV